VGHSWWSNRRCGYALFEARSDCCRLEFAGALYEIGPALSLFQIRNYADEFTNALKGRPAPQPPKDDETVAAVAEDIEEMTRDFVFKQLATELKGHPLAAFVADLLNAMGYHTRLSLEGPDAF